MDAKQRAALERLVWKHTHADFRGKREDTGAKCVLHFVTGAGTCSVEIASLPDATLLEKLPSKVREAFLAAQ